MRLKYYLRGAGIGMLVTAIILATALKLMGYEKKEYVDNAAQESILGEKLENEMQSKAESATELDNATEPAKGTEQESNLIDEENTSETIQGLDDKEVDSLENIDADEQTKPEVQNEPEDNKQTDEIETTDLHQDVESNTDTEIVNFTINGGQFSEQVSKNLEASGLVDDASKFNEYICEKGYDNYLQPGNYDIPKGSSYDDIAKILTKRR